MSRREFTSVGALVRAAAAVGLGAGFGCSATDDLGLGRKFDTLVTCGGAPPLEEALARVDVNGDGRLSPDDLVAGELLFLLRTHGAHVDSRTPDIERVSIHSDWDAHLQHEDGVWSLHATANCSPAAQLTFLFEASALDPGEPFEAPFTGFEFHAVTAMAVTRDPEVEGVFTGTAGEGVLSGLLEGSVTGALHSEVPEAFGRSEITGQTVHLEALAFRDVEVLP